MIGALLPTLELVYEDASGDTGSITVTLASSTTVAEAYSAADALISVVNPLTDAVLVRTRLKYRFREDTRPDASEGSSIKRQGAFFFSTTFMNGLSSVFVPSILPELLVTSGPAAGIMIDDTDSRVASFNEQLLLAGATDPFNNAFVEFLIAYLQSRV